MKIFFQMNKIASCRAGVSGFTLVEMMLVVGIFAFIILAIVTVQLFAMRIYTRAATKLTATTAGRQTMDAIRDQIRSAKNVYVGTYSGTTFTQAALGTVQKGNALEIAYTNGITTNLVYYLYQDPSANPTNILYSVINGTKTVLAKYVTNYYCFFAEDYQGNPLYNYQNNPAIHVVLQFCQWEYPIGVVGTNGQNAYDFYTLQTRITRRSKQ
jgi:type II secretory pathway pseudopilin PulG